MYLGPSCPDCPFSAELGDMDINTWIRGVLDHGADLNLDSSPIPFRGRVDNPWVSSLGFLFGFICRFMFLTECVFLLRASGALTVPHGGSPYLRMWQDGRPTMSTANGFGHGGRGDGTGASSEGRQGRGWRKLPLSPNPQEETTKRRMRTERREK
jgi:hypothetical protein